MIHPHWEFNLDVSDVFHNEALSFEQIRDDVVARIRASRWYARYGGEGTDLGDVVDELAETDSVDHFDWTWNEIYNHADKDRCWITTR